MIKQNKQIKDCKYNKHVFRFYRKDIIVLNGTKGIYDEWKCIHCPTREVRKRIK